MKIIRTVKNPVPESNIRFFDIETTGLSAQTSFVYLIGIMGTEKDQCILTQFFCEDPNEEKELLEAFVSVLSSEYTLIHYNGSGFDIPYLNKKFKKYGINFFIDPEKTRDLYKEILHFKKYLPLDNLKLKTVEAAAGFERKDTYDGAELIHIYSELLGKIRLASLTGKPEDIEKADQQRDILLLHNSDDLEGLYAVYCKTYIQAALSGHLSPTVDLNPFELTFSYPKPLFPVETEISLPFLNLSNNNKGCEISVPVKSGVMKYFFSDYKNYTYIIDRDMCMHNSVVSGVSKDNKKKCTKETAYIKKSGSFLPIPKSMLDYSEERRMRLFKESYDSKIFYTEINKDSDFLNEYMLSILNEI